MSLNKRCRFNNLHLKLIVVGILLMSIGSAMAWDEETGYAEGEYVDIEFTDGSTYLDHKDNMAPAWISYPLLLIIKFVSFFTGDLDANDIDVTINTTVEKWDGDSYEPDGTSWESGTTSEAFANNTVMREMSWDPIGEYFRNNTEELENFTTRDDDPEHPDILNVSVSIEGGGVDIQDYGYTTIDDDDLQEISDGINNPDYGFGLTGRGSGGGSGSIYEGVDMYGSTGGDATGMGSSFNTIFWCIIPLIFILSIMKLSSRVLK